VRKIISKNLSQTVANTTNLLIFASSKSHTTKAHTMIIEKNYSGWLDLRGTQITALPEGLTVGGSLDLQGTQITALPEGLTVGGSLDLQGTQITALPEGLTVGGWLDLRGTQITALPEGLTVGGSLYLQDTQITALPEGLTVGGSLYLQDTKITGCQYRCGKEERTIIAYTHPSKGRVVSLGCFVGTEEEAEFAVREKYGTTTEADEYIEKIKAAFAF